MRRPAPNLARALACLPGASLPGSTEGPPNRRRSRFLQPSVYDGERPAEMGSPAARTAVTQDGHCFFPYRWEIRSGRCRHDECRRSRGSPERDRLRGVSRFRGLVVTPETVCGMRPHRMLRQLAEPARDRPRQLVGSHRHMQLRAGRGLVLGLPNERIHGRASSRTSAASSPRPTRARTSRTGSPKLARPVGGIVTTR